MAKKLLLVNLHSAVREFCLQDRHRLKLKTIFKEYEIHFTDSKDDFLRVLPQASLVLVWFFQKEWYADAPLLEAVMTPAAGKDWAQEDPSGKIPVHYGHFHGNIIAETVLGIMLHFNHRFSFPLKNQAIRKWDRNFPLSPVCLRGQTVVIVGYGAIGRFVAQLLAPFKCRVIGVKRIIIPPDGFTEKIVSMKELVAVLPMADHVVLALPGGTETGGLFSKELFRFMKKTAFLYNIGRGNCVREEDLTDVLLQQMIAGAYLDVFDPEPLPASSPLWGLENVIITPHASAFAENYLDLWFEEIYKKRIPHV